MEMTVTQGIASDLGVNGAPDLAEVKPAAEETAEEPDYKALAEKVQVELEQERAARLKNERDQRARDINLLNQKRRDEIATATHVLVQDILKRLDGGTLSEANMEQAIRQGVTQIQEKADTTLASEQNRQAMQETEQTLKSTGVSLGLGPDLSDPRAGNVILMWNEAVQAYRAGRYDVAEVRRGDALRELDLVEKSIGRPEKGLSLNASPGGRAAGPSRQSLVDRLAAGEWMSPEDVAAAGEAMDNGIYPQKRK